MSVLEGVDFSSARPGGAAIAGAGKKFVVRYVPYGKYKKGLTADEIVDYHAHGLAICVVWESTANRALDGAAAGKADALTADHALTGLGFPPGQPIYFGVDFDAQQQHLAKIDAYLTGAAAAIGNDRIGVYGHARLLAHCAGARTARWFWQTYAWSGGVVYAGNHLLQYRNGQTLNGGAVDLCRTTKAEYGQWEANDVAADIDVTDPVPGLVDLAKGIDILNLDGSARTTLSAARTSVVSPFASTSAGGTALRAIVYSRPQPDADLLLAVYAKDAANRRPLSEPVDDTATIAAAKVEGARAEWDRQNTGAGIKISLLDRP